MIVVSATPILVSTVSVLLEVQQSWIGCSSTATRPVSPITRLAGLGRRGKYSTERYYV